MAQSHQKKFIQDILKKQYLKSEETLELIGQYRRARKPERKEDLRRRIVEGNSRLAARYAGSYLRLHPQSNFDDLFQNAIIGVLLAIDKFDLSRRETFSTYATWWIRRSIHQGEEVNTEFRMASQYKSIVARYLTCKAKYKTPEAIEANLHKYKLKDSIKRLEMLSNSYRILASLVELDKDRQFDGDAYNLKDIIKDPDAINPELICEQKDLSEKVRRVIEDSLTPEEQKVIEGRFLVEEELTLDEVAVSIGKSKERVRQIEHKAMRKLKSPLKDLLNDKLIKKTDDNEFTVSPFREYKEAGMHIYKVGRAGKIVKIRSTSAKAAAIYFTMHLDRNSPDPPKVYTEDGGAYRGEPVWRDWFYNRSVTPEIDNKLVDELFKTSIIRL